MYLAFFSIAIPYLVFGMAKLFLPVRFNVWILLSPICILLPILAVVAHTGQIGATRDLEFFGGYFTQVTAYEDWDEKVSCRHTKYCERPVTKDVKDSTGKVTGTRTETERYACGTEHSYDVDYHAPEWKGETNTGSDIWVSQSNFEELSRRWGNSKYVLLNRRVYSPNRYKGNKYVSDWNNNSTTIEPYFTSHYYENRPRVSNSTISFSQVEEREIKGYGLHSYPQISGYLQPSILGYNAPDSQKAEKYLTYINAIMGEPYQIRVFLLVFENKPVEAGLMQEALWEGGNKNEMVVCVGLDKERKVKWCYPFSWTEKNDFKTAIKNSVMGQRDQVFNPLPVLRTIEKSTPKMWKRKAFADFAELAVEFTPGTLWAFFILSLLFSGVATFLSTLRSS